MVVPSRSWLSRPVRSASGSCRNHGGGVRGVGLGLLFGCRWFRLGALVPRVPAQPALSFLKLVEPTCERQRVGRVETVVGVFGVLWSGLPTGSGVVSTRVARSSLPGSTGFGRVLASRLNQLQRRRSPSNCPIRMSRAYLFPHRKALMGPSPRSCRKNGASSLDPAAIDNRVGRPARPRRVVPRVPARPSGSFSQQPRYR